MSASENGSSASQEGAMAEAPQQNLVTRVVNLPLVKSAYNMVSNAYATTKKNHQFIKTVCEIAENHAKAITSAAYTSVQPILNKLEPQISAANGYACKGLDRLEEKLPLLQQSTEKVVADAREHVFATITGAREAVSSTVNGAKDVVTTRVMRVMEAAKRVVQDGVDMTKAVVNNSVTVMASCVGQQVSSGVDTVLGKSEKLVYHYLPMTDEELAQLAASVERCEVATKQQQSYFVRLGFLTSKLRHSAYQNSWRKIDLVKQSVQGGQKKLHQLWVDWSQKQTGSADQDHTDEPEEDGSSCPCNDS